MRSKIVSVITGISILASVAFVAFVYDKCNYITDVVLADEITAGPEWQTIELRRPILISQDVNKLNIDPAPPFEHLVGNKFISGPSGIEFLPEVEAVTSNGDIIQLPYSGGRFNSNHDFVSFSRLYDLDKGTTIQAIRLRSPYEFRIHTIWWSSFDAKDMP